MNSGDITIRRAVREADVVGVRELLEGTGFFYDAEVEIAEELIRETIQRGEASGYRFIFADGPEGLRGYSCYGPVPLTRSSWDLYWIAVRSDLRGKGIGRMLLRLSEETIRRSGGTRVYVDTSSREQYRPTRDFYAAMGYTVAADMEDFYAPGDGKIVFMKRL
ncbi:MAG: GNAT family N-acetyltransferase [Spirochaetes bacterium]|nr:GNAT family N-acetyltransferase [Spirochaetota bacterium]